MADFFKKHFNYFCFTYLLFIFLFILFRPLNSYPDTKSYLDVVIIRPGVYPMFLTILKSLFGSYLAIAIKFFHGLFGVFAISFFIKSLVKNFNFSTLTLFATLLIVSSPYLFDNTNIGNKILSEGLSYPLYLITVSYFISYLIKEENKFFVRGLLVLFILIQTRSQFMFLIPIALILLAYISYKHNSYFKNKYYFLIILMFPVLVSFADKTYHKIAHDKYVSTPWTGIHLLTPAIFVADECDFSIYKNQEEQAFYKSVFDELKHKGLNIHQLDTKQTDASIFYINHFSDIANHTIFEVGKKKYNGLTENEQIIATDRLTKSMTLPLILNNFKGWIIIYIKNFINAFGSFKYLTLYILLLLFSIYKLVKSDSKIFKFIALIMLLTFANITLVSLGMHTIKRFTFYNFWTIFLAIFALLELINNSNLIKNE